MKFKIGIDVGGTFTDLFLWSDAGTVRTFKTLSTPEDPSIGFMNGLQQAGLALSVLSNKPHEFTCVCVQQMLPDWTFDPLLGARPEVPKKPNPAAAVEIASRLQLDPAEILYLGDTATDMKTATGAGMYAVGALWGFRTAEELTANGAAKIISMPQQLLDLI